MKYSYITFAYLEDKEYYNYLSVCQVLKTLRISFTTYSDVDDDDNRVFYIEVNGKYLGGYYEL